MSFLPDHNVFKLPRETNALRRPKALIRAARAGQCGWRRERDLARLLGCETAPVGPVAMRMLRVAEDAADRARRESRADYDMHRHVRLLIALLAEIIAAQPVVAHAGPAGKVLAFSGRGKAPPARPA